MRAGLVLALLLLAASDAEAGFARFRKNVVTTTAAQGLIPAVQCSGVAIASVTVTRAGTATCLKSDGTLVSISANTPRQEANGLLVEQALTNGISAPEVLDANPWIYTNVGLANPTVSADTTDVADPLGTNVAEKIVFPAVSGAGNASFIYYDTGASGSAASDAVFLRGSSSGTVYLQEDNGFSLMNTAACDFTSTAWTRCKLQNVTHRQYLTLGTDLRAFTNTGDTPAATPLQTVYAIFAQYEAGPETTSYTSTSRSADAVTITNPIASADTDWCISVTARPLNRSWVRGFVAGLFGLGTSAAANSARFYVNATGFLVSDTYDAAGAVRTRTGQTVLSSGSHALRYCNRGGQVFHYVDSIAQPVTLTADTGTGVIGTQPGTSRVGSYAAAKELNGWVSSVCLATGSGCGNTGNTIAVIGDSLSAGFSSPQWAPSLDALTGSTSSYMYASGGKQTDYMYATQWITNKAKNGHFAYVTVEGTDNDAAADRTAVAIEGSLTSLYDEVLAQGAKLLIITTSPWDGNAVWTTDRQTVTETVRAWQIAYAAAHSNTYLYDAYTDLADSVDPKALKAVYSIDGTHRTQAGQDRVAAQVKATLGL